MENNEKKFKSFMDFDPEFDPQEERPSDVEILEIIQKKKWGLFAILAFIFVPQVTFLFITLIFGLPEAGDDLRFMFLTGISQVIATPLMLIIVLKYCKDVLPNFKSTFKVSPETMSRKEKYLERISKDKYENQNDKTKDKTLAFFYKFKYIIVFMFMFGIYYLLSTALMEFTYLITGSSMGDSSGNQGSIEELISDSPVIGFLMVVVAAPITEELFARYGIFHIVKSRKWAAFWSIFIFAALHVITQAATNGILELLWIFPYFAGGIVFTFVYIYCDYKIFYPMLLHSLTNLIVFIVLVAS